MNDTPNIHEPAPEFTQYLARDIARTLRHEARFAPSPGSSRARRARVAVVSVAGTVVTLVVGLILGTSNGYAAARVDSDRRVGELAANTAGVTAQLTALRVDLARARDDLAHQMSQDHALSPDAVKAAEAELRSMEASVERIELDLTQGQARIARPTAAALHVVPVTRALAVTCNALALDSAAAPPAPQTVQTFDLAAASAKTGPVFWSVAGIRSLPNGKLLVNDVEDHQIRLFDSTLATSTVALDSTSAGGPTFGPQTPLLAYLGDSSLFADPRAHTLHVLNANGQIARSVALPFMTFPIGAPAYVDAKGRLLFAGATWVSRTDSASILRLDLASGRIDTVARVRQGSGLDLRWFVAERGAPVGSAGAINLSARDASAIVPGRDDWAVLADGTIAIVRGHDYHVDLIRPDGTTTTAPKLPFDWDRLASENRQQLADAGRMALARHDSVGRLIARLDSLKLSIVRRDSFSLQYARLANSVLLRTLRISPSASALIPDADGNLWILPSGMPPASQSAVYDVINSKGQLTQRVRIPAGRSIAGFGKGGVVYLLGGDRSNGFFLERTGIVGAAR